jgi:hypothetical protein
LQQDQATFEAFLEPLKHLKWPILAVFSDKQTGLGSALATVLPHSHHQWCQVHYLRDVAEPPAEADAAFKGELRKAVCQHVGDMIHKEPYADLALSPNSLPAHPQRPTALSPICTTASELGSATEKRHRGTVAGLRPQQYHEGEKILSM